MKASVSFKCQEKKCPAEDEEDSKLNKQSKITLKIVSVVVLAWISVGRAASLTMLTRKAGGLYRRWSLQRVFLLFPHSWFDTVIL